MCEHNTWKWSLSLGMRKSLGTTESLSSRWTCRGRDKVAAAWAVSSYMGMQSHPLFLEHCQDRAVLGRQMVVTGEARLKMYFQKGLVKASVGNKRQREATVDTKTERTIWGAAGSKGDPSSPPTQSSDGQIARNRTDEDLPFFGQGRKT